MLFIEINHLLIRDQAGYIIFIKLTKTQIFLFLSVQPGPTKREILGLTYLRSTDIWTLKDFYEFVFVALKSLNYGFIFFPFFMLSQGESLLWPRARSEQRDIIKFAMQNREDDEATCLISGDSNLYKNTNKLRQNAGLIFSSPSLGIIIIFTSAHWLHTICCWSRE